ncbi:MAG: hypothetical protein ABEJ23_05230 [Haloarculaceae archaeon]
MDRRALLGGAASVAGFAAFAGCLDAALDAVQGDVSFFMSFHRSHPSDRPLVVDGLEPDGTRDQYARLLTARPREPVFTDAVEDAAPHMRSQVRKDDDERFCLVAELRFDTPTRLGLSRPVTPRWKSWRRLRIPADVRPLAHPGERLRDADGVVATMLAIFEHEGATPEVLAMPVTDGDGRPVSTLWAT